VRRTLLIAALTPLFALTAVPAHASARSTLLSRTNEARSDYHRRAYLNQQELNRIAQRWARHMAETNTLEHNPNMTRSMSCWQTAGENIGAGPSASAIYRAFMRSQSHRDNILSRSFADIGIGAARNSGGTLFVDEVFRRC